MDSFIIKNNKNKRRAWKEKKEEKQGVEERVKYSHENGIRRYLTRSVGVFLEPLRIPCAGSRHASKFSFDNFVII